MELSSKTWCTIKPPFVLRKSTMLILSQTLNITRPGHKAKEANMIGTEDTRNNEKNKK